MNHSLPHRFLVLLVAVTGIALSITSCGGGGSGGQAPNQQLSSQVISFAQAGPVQLLATDTYSNIASGGAGGGAISYTSSNDSIATVSNSGQISAIAAATVTITATKAADTQYAAAYARYGIDV
jgi:hypothetical protein